MSSLIHEFFKAIGLSESLAGTLRTIECIFLGLGACGFIGLFFKKNYLKDNLLPIFDSRFKSKIPTFGGLSDITDGFGRASTYATWVVSARRFARGTPEVRNHDFRSEVSPEVLKACKRHVFYIALCGVGCFGAIGAQIYFWIFRHWV